jgi:Ribbon-helix-helix protein, copG family
MPQKRMQTTVRIDEDQMSQLEKYRNVTGVSVAQSIREALDYHISIVLHSRMAVLKKKSPKK